MKLFVWDFHGVMEKGTEGAVLEISNKILERFDYSQRFTKENIARLYGLRWFEYFKYLLPQEPHKRHLALQKHCFEMSINNLEIIAKHVRPSDHIHEVLDEINRKHCQILISNTDPESLKIFLDTVEITHYFPRDRIFSADSHRNLARTKKDILKEFVKDKKFEKIIVIGDTQEDVDLASFVGGTSYLYSHLGKPFKKCNADYKIHDLRMLLEEV